MVPCAINYAPVAWKNHIEVETSFRCSVLLTGEVLTRLP